MLAIDYSFVMDTASLLPRVPVSCMQSVHDVPPAPRWRLVDAREFAQVLRGGVLKVHQVPSALQLDAEPFVAISYRLGWTGALTDWRARLRVVEYGEAYGRHSCYEKRLASLRLVDPFDDGAWFSGRRYWRTLRWR
ncbi:hypothetical protein C8Q80DRAFT_203848 [Daedaleopsis nitida]|nr:hypothetical protein C8Q80DRAFT_203848 [Daedaleopsis nitida]